MQVSKGGFTASGNDCGPGNSPPTRGNFRKSILATGVDMASSRPRDRSIQSLPDTRTRWRHPDDPRRRQLEGVQCAFEISRAQVDPASLSAPEWLQAADVLDRAYDACAGQEDHSIVAELCLLVGKYVTIAVEKSTLQSARRSASFDV
jgi:hypothetical protein